ncbi:hypothetical protein OAO01_04220 [Oligoflexia bacterium]|nr:hypothetical protein [Oligoflexia bacterium]
MDTFQGPERETPDPARTGSPLPVPRALAPITQPTTLRESLPDKPGTMFRGLDIVLSDQMSRAREELLLRLLGPAAGNDAEFSGALLADELDGFELVPDKVRLKVEVARGRIWTGPGMTYTGWMITIEGREADKWQALENLSCIAGEAGTAFRDGRNRVTEFCIATDHFLGNIKSDLYQKLFNKLVEVLPPRTDVLFSTNDPLTLIELASALPEGYSDIEKPRAFYYSVEEVAEVLRTVSERLENAKPGEAPLLTDKERVVLETTLADASILRERAEGVGDEPYIRQMAAGLVNKGWPEGVDIGSLLKFKVDARNLSASSFLLTHSTKARAAYVAGLRSFRLQIAYSHGETCGSPLWRPEDGKFDICLRTKKGRTWLPVVAAPVHELLGAPKASVPVLSAPDISPARTLLDALERTRRASRYDELAEYEQDGMLECMEMLANAEGRDLRRVRPYLRFPEENLVITPPHGKNWRMDRGRFEEFVAQSRAGNEEVGPLARSYYSQAERMIMERISPTGDLAITFVYRGTNCSSVDRKDEASPVIAAIEAMQDAGYFVRTGTPIDIDPIDTLQFEAEQRADVAHLLDATWGRLQQKESGKAGIVCGFWMGIDVKSTMKRVLPTSAELQETSVKRISIEIEGIFTDGNKFPHAKEAQLTAEELMSEKWTKANERSMSDIWIATDGIGAYVRELREAGIEVEVRGLGDPRGELEFYDLSRFEKVMKEGRNAINAGADPAEVVAEVASALDSRIAPEMIIIGFGGVKIGRWMPMPQAAYIYAAQLDLLEERAIRDEDSFVVEALAMMEFNAVFLRDFAEKETNPTPARRARQFRDKLLRGVNRLFRGRLLSGPTSEEK